MTTIEQGSVQDLYNHAVDFALVYAHDHPSGEEEGHVLTYRDRIFFTRVRESLNLIKCGPEV